MKITLLLLFSFISISAYSQNWELIQADEIYYYSRTDSVGIVNSMRVEDYYQSNDTSYFILHDNYMLSKDTCVYVYDEADGDLYNNSIGSLIFFPSDSLCHYYYPNGSILGKEIYTNNSIEYYFNEGNRIINTQGQLGESWLYDINDSLYAEVVSIFEENVFEISDSIKTIHISFSNGTVIDSIKIAKNHGLVLYPVGNGYYYQNEGIQSDNFNEAFMTFDKLFNYHVGDVFVLYYSHVHAGDYQQLSSFSRFEVTSIDSSGLYNKYICDVAHKRQTYDYEDDVFIENSGFISGQIYDPYLLYGSSYTFPGEIGVLEMNSNVINVGDFSLEIETIGLSNFGFVNSFSSSYSLSYNDAFNSLLYFNLFNEVGVNDTDRVIVKGVPWGCYNCETDNEYYPKSFSSIWSSVLDGFHVDISSGVVSAADGWCHIYQEGFGLVYMGYAIFEVGEYISLMGAIKNGITYGNVPTASQLLGIDELNFSDLNIDVHPVPFMDSFSITNSEQSKVEVRIYDIIGKELLVKSLSFGENKVDMTSYKGNAFILKFISDKGISTKKVLRAN